MILIANPVYDVVFKYLLEDRESAMILLSNILGEEILELELRPQEHVVELTERSLTVFRLDFAARIKTGPDTSKLVILEIQKAKLATDIMRFRRYLGKQYMNKDNVFRTSEHEVQALPIVSIYFLAYDLGTLSPPVIRVKRSYQDVRTQTTLKDQHPFIESLTHDAFIVQLSKLQEPYQTELEKLLSILDQHKRTQDGKELKLDETQYPVAFRRLKDRLLRANAEEKLREQMDIEEDVIEELERLERKVEAKEKQLEEKDKKLEELHHTLTGTSQQLQEKDKKLEELHHTLTGTSQQLQEKDKKLEELHHTLTGTSQQLQEKDKKLEEQDKKLEEQEQKLQEKDKKLEEQDKRLEDFYAILREQARKIEELQQTVRGR